MKSAIAFAFIAGLAVISAAQAASPVLVDFGSAAPMSLASDGLAPIDVAASLSCSPRKTCTRINSCDEAYWYYRNCSWGGKLDGDSDGVPCESMCR